MSLSRFLPLTLRHLLAKGGNLEAPLYLDGATLFADISGFTPLSEALARMGREGAETLTRTLNGYFTAVIAAIQGNKGDVMRFAGDAVTAFFPDPGGEARALAAAHAIQAFMGSHPETASPVGSFPIRIKVGIAAGEHVLLPVGEDKARDYVFAGRPVDGSAEAEHHAQAGETVVKSKQFKVRSSKFKVEKAAEGFWRIAGFPSALETRNSKLETQEGGPDLSPHEAACAPFLHPILVERLGQGSERLMNEHRKTTVLFVSFPGVSDYHDRAAVERLRSFYTATRSFVDCYEGNLNKVDMGDKGSKFLITFGAPLSHEDDADRAVHFALDLKDMAGARGLPLAIGLNRGTLFAGLIGDDRRCEYTVMGDEVNLAARLMQAAGPGRILAGPGVQAESRAYEFTALPPVVLKGKSRPVAVFEPLKREVEQQAGTGIFAGRTPELRKAAEFALQPGEEVRLLLLQGEAGIGKTAFLNHLFQQHLSSMCPVSGWCREFTAQFPYHPWKFILRKLLEIADPDGGDPAEAWITILRGSVPELVPFAPILLDLLQVQHSLPPAATDEQTRKNILHRQAGLLVQAARKQGPLALSLTDAQWMDPESEGLLEDLLRRLGPPAPLIVLSGRALPGALEKMVAAHRIELGPLPEADLNKIALAFLKVRRAPEKLLVDAAAASGGNPLLLQETLRAYLDAGYVTRDAQNPELLFLDETRKPALPTTLEGVVMARFDRLPAGQQALLKTLAVFGDSIPGEVARRAAIDTGNDPVLLEVLAEDGEFITRQGPEGFYAFPQSHVRSTIYDSLDFDSRRELHRRAAQIYQKALPPDTPETIQTVAFHYLQADAALEGKAFLLKAGRSAYDANALATALLFYQALMDHKDRLDEDLRADIAGLLASIYLTIGMFKDIQTLITPSLLGSIQSKDARARLMLIAADSYRLTGAFGIAENYLSQASMLANSPLTRFKILYSHGTMFAQTGQLNKALDLFRELLRDYGNKVPNAELVKISTIYGPLLFATGDRTGAIFELNRAKKRLSALNDPPQLIKVLHNLGTVWDNSGQHKKALSAFKSSLKCQEQFGIYMYHGTTLNEIGYESMLAGKWDEAEYYFQLGLSVTRKVGDPIQVRVLSNMAELCQHRGDFEKARTLLLEANKASNQFDFESLQVRYYWLEYMARLPYPPLMIRILKQLERQMKDSHAFFLQHLCQAYSSLYYCLIGNIHDARLGAISVIENADAKSQPKEVYLARRVRYCLSPDDAANAESLIVSAERTHQAHYVLDAVILLTRNREDKILMRKGDGILHNAPYSCLAWKYYLNKAQHSLGRGSMRYASQYVTKAKAIYERVGARIPWKAARHYFMHTDEALQLMELSKKISQEIE